MDKKHQKITRHIQDQVKAYFLDKIPFRVYHGSTNSTRVLTFKKGEMVDTSRLNRVLNVDTARKVVLAESNVPMDKLVRATLKHGLIPPVVTEFPGITVGGGIQGAAAETSSFKWGCFSQTINWMEMVLGNGELVQTSPELRSDLFYATAGSCGSLGLVTAAEIQLIPAKKYVTITHYPVASFDEAVGLSKKFTHEDCDFIEGLMFEKGMGSIIVGRFSNKAIGPVRRFSRAFDDWYYLHSLAVAKTRIEVTESLPLRDYIFRYNRGAFWGGQLAFDHFGVKFNSLNRFLLDPILRTRKLYQALQESAAAQMYICQDIILPAKSTARFMNYIDKQFDMYPMLLCPMKPEPRSPLQCNGIDADLLFNIGVYGLKITPYSKFVEANQHIETETKRLGGKKWFYAHSYYSLEQFWQIYDKVWYNKLRKKYHATTLPDIFTRTRVREHRDIDTKKAAIRTVLGRAKLKVVD